MKYFLSSAAIVALSFLAVGCSNEDAVVGTTEGQFTTFVGGMSSAPTTRVQLNENGSVSASTLTELTRTSMERTALNAGATFSWEKDDFVWVEVGTSTYNKSDYVTTKGAEFKFKVEGNLTEDSYKVYYTGSGNGSGNGNAYTKVTIAQSQKASGYNNTEHFGASGDCGVATAKKEANGAYSFKLDHKAAYLCLLPYISDPMTRVNYKIKSVKVTSNNEIAGSYNLLNSSLEGSNTKDITLIVGDGNGLALANLDVATKNIANSLYMVVAPGTHQLTVEITVLDGTTNADVTIEKSFKETALDANKVYDIPVSLNSKDYKEYDIKGMSNSFELAQPLQADLPTVFEALWYIEKGDVCWDKDIEWRANGQTYKGGIWVKRLSVIAQENGTKPSEMETQGPNGEMVKENVGANPVVARTKSVRPDADNIKDYFFLPLSGSWDPTQQNPPSTLGLYGYYWTKDGLDKEEHITYPDGTSEIQKVGFMVFFRSDTNLVSLSRCNQKIAGVVYKNLFQ